MSYFIFLYYLVNNLFFLNRIIYEPDDVKDYQIQKRQPRMVNNLPLNLRSPFWVSNKNKMMRVSRTEQLISDYALIQHDESNKWYYSYCL